VTHPNLKHLPDPSAIIASPDVVVVAAAPGAPAANDAVAESQDMSRNPLWIIVMAMACLFGVMTAVMAIG
jgi:hypothetical protein